MPEILDKFSPGQLIGLVATVGGILGWIIISVAQQWRKVRLAEMEAALKQQMLERGMAATDMEQVLRSSKRGEPVSFLRRNTVAPKAAVVKALTDGGYEGADIESILRAFGTHPEQEVVAQREGPERAEAFGRVLAAKVQIVEIMAANGNEAEEIVCVLSEYKDDGEWRIQNRQPEALRG